MKVSVILAVLSLSAPLMFAAPSMAQAGSPHITLHFGWHHGAGGVHFGHPHHFGHHRHFGHHHHFGHFGHGHH